VTFEEVTMQQVKMYSIYAFLFVGSVYASMKSLEHSNVETQIVFRAATPIAVSGLDALFLGRELPGFKSLVALGAVACGAVAYVLTDAEFAMKGLEAYAWVSVYYVVICAEMTLGKHLTSATPVKHVWTSVLLTNALSLPFLFLLAWSRGEFATFAMAAAETTTDQWVIILCGCVTGTMIGWAGWYCRGTVSATSYTLIGVANKMFTVSAHTRHTSHIAARHCAPEMGCVEQIR
jgi:GDP-mannose transporter